MDGGWTVQNISELTLRDKDIRDKSAGRMLELCLLFIFIVRLRYFIGPCEKSFSYICSQEIMKKVNKK